jgi:hypothetical protein
MSVVANKKQTMGGAKGKLTLGTRKPSAKSQPAAMGNTITIDRRDNGERRQGSDRRMHECSVSEDRRTTMPRRAKVNRRRQIDPTTCERDYSIDEIEFMSAMDAYKRRSGRMFPTCSEVLEVIKSLGYQKTPAAPPAPAMPTLDAPIEAAAMPVFA